MAYPDYSKVFESYTDTSSNWLGTVTTQDYCQPRLLIPSIWNLLWNAVQCYRNYSAGVIDRHRSINYSPSTGLLRSLVGTLRHAIHLQCHQIELLAIDERKEFKRNTKGLTYKCLLITSKKISYEMLYAQTSYWMKVTA